MPDDTLLALLDLTRRRTLRRLDGVTEEQAVWTPSDLHNSILWHAGHAYVVVEWLSMEALARSTEMPDGWFELFNWESRPEQTPPDRWPTLAAVVDRLGAQRERLRSIYAGLTQEQLAAPAPDRPHRSVRYLILRGLHDEACHTGEIWLLRKMLKAGSIAFAPLNRTPR